MKLRENEDSWKIDVISEINSYVSKKLIRITRATGEQTIPGITRFPDVILYGGSAGNELLQGWELKMPDTPIMADDPYLKAIEKANTMGLNSFTLWNAREAAIFIKDEKENRFNRVKDWIIEEIHNRSDVAKYRKIWIETLHDIIDTLNTLLNGKSIKSISPFDAINKSTYDQYIVGLTPYVSNCLETKSRKDKLFAEQINAWWASSQADYPDKSDKLMTLSRMIIVNWINRFVFVHYLKKYFDVANIVDSIDINTGISEALNVFEKMSDICDFYNVLARSFADDCIDDYCWRNFCELNNFLKEVRITEVSQESLQSFLKNVVTISKRESAGQFCTPPLLAKLLVELSMSNADGIVLDPCCGTGTIPREVVATKKLREVKNPQSTVWASDKFQYPLSLASISLANPDNIQDPIQVFKMDVFKLHSGLTIQLTDSKTGLKISYQLPVIDTIVSNLPFVRFEKAEESNPDVRIICLNDKRSDLYAHIALNLKHLLSKNGRVGIITSNSWLGADWAKEFRDALINQYFVKTIVVSQVGRWFKDVDVVTTILILENRTSPFKDDEVIRYVSIAEKIENWSNENLFKEMVSDIWLNNDKSKHVCIHNHSVKNLRDSYEIGFGPMIGFTNMEWIIQIRNLVTPVSSFFEIARGSRRGWNPLFYPKNPDRIEKEFLKPVLKSSKKVNSLIAEPDSLAFCCMKTVDDLIDENKIGALSWIDSFKNGVNGTGKPLTEVLRKAKLQWYQMSETETADFGMSENPNNRLFVFRFKNKTFVDQRIIRLSSINHTDLDLIHALINSTFGMLMIESQGFGRGLGVLDLNATKMEKSYCMLNPSLLNEKESNGIKQAFIPLLSRPPKELPDEIASDDRRKFDKIVLEAYGIAELQDKISITLLKLYQIRKAVEIDK